MSAPAKCFLMAALFLAPVAASPGDGAKGIRGQLLQHGLKLGELKKEVKSELTDFLDSITGTNITVNATTLTALLNTKDGKKPEIQLPKAANGKASEARLTIQRLGRLASKAVVQAVQATREGFQQLGLPFNSRAEFLFAADRWTDANEDANGEPFSFRVVLPDVDDGLVVRSYTENNTNGTDITTENGTVTYLGNGTWECNSTHTSAFSGEIGSFIDSLLNATGVNLAKLLRDQGIPLGGFRKLAKADLTSFLNSITSNSVVQNATALLASLTAKDGNRPQLQLPPGIATKVAAAKLSLQNLGTTATKAVVQALQANRQGFEQLGLKFPEARKPAFLFAADRWTDANEDANGQPFSFRVALDGVTSGLVIRTYTDTAPDGVDVTTDGGLVRLLSDGTWECNVTHTSAFSGEIVDSSSGSGALALSAAHPIAAMLTLATLFLFAW